MSFIWPFMLLTLVLVPLFAVLYFRLLGRRQRLADELGPLGLVQSTSGRKLGRLRHLPPAFYLLGLTLLLFGLARPEMIVDLPHTEGTVILAFDVSNSMMADDLQPTRIDAAKAAARSFVENQPSTILIGVVAFSTGGLIVQQPTDDQAAVLAAIDRLSTQGGTSLGRGIFTSLNAIAGEALAIEGTAVDDTTFDESALAEGAEPVRIGDYSSAVIVLLSDGENTGSPDPLEVAQVAAEAGVRIYPVGIGSQEGSVIELEGFSILTQLNESTLQEMASLTNGAYYYAEDEASLEEIYRTIDLQLTIRGEMMEVTSLLAGLSLIPLLIGGALSMRWFGRIP